MIRALDLMRRALRDPDAVVFWGVLAMAGVAVANGWLP